MQYVQIEGIISEHAKLVCGVPQESFLGPLHIFIVFLSIELDHTYPFVFLIFLIVVLVVYIIVLFYSILNLFGKTPYGVLKIIYHTERNIQEFFYETF